MGIEDIKSGEDVQRATARLREKGLWHDKNAATLERMCRGRDSAESFKALTRGNKAADAALAGIGGKKRGRPRKQKELSSLTE